MGKISTGGAYTIFSGVRSVALFSRISTLLPAPITFKNYGHLENNAKTHPSRYM